MLSGPKRADVARHDVSMVDLRLKRDFESQTLGHADALYRTAYHLCRNRVEAEDLTQETYLRAFRAFGSFRGGNIRSWLFTILRHAFLDECRRRTRRCESPIDDFGPERLGTSEPSAESEALRGLPSEALERAFTTLPTEWRMLVILADVEEFSYRELADIMDIPQGTVMSRLHRARGRLRDSLEPARGTQRGSGQSA